MVDSLEQTLSSLSSAAAGRRTRGFSRWHAVRRRGRYPPATRRSPNRRRGYSRAPPLGCWAARSPGTLLLLLRSRRAELWKSLFSEDFIFFLAFTIVGDRLCHVRVLGLGGGGARAREGRSEAKMDLNHHLYEEAGTPDAGKPTGRREAEEAGGGGEVRVDAATEPQRERERERERGRERETLEESPRPKVCSTQTAEQGGDDETKADRPPLCVPCRELYNSLLSQVHVLH